MESKTYLNLFPPQGGVFSCCSPQRIITRQNLDHQKYCSIPFGAYVQATYSNTKTNDQLPRTLDCIYLRHSPNTKDGHQSLHLPTGHVITRAWSSYPCSHHPKWDWSGAWSCHPRWHGYEDKDEPQLPAGILTDDTQFHADIPQMTHEWHTDSCWYFCRWLTDSCRQSFSWSTTTGQFNRRGRRNQMMRRENPITLLVLKKKPAVLRPILNYC